MALTTAALNRTHPTYDTLEDTWTLLQEAYRGDGGFLTGDNLIAHPREVIYLLNPDGSPSATVQGYKDKYTRRQTLARYENFARTIIDTYLAHLFAKPVIRKAEALPGLEDWWQNVDGAGTSIDAWMLQQQALAMVYGHIAVLMDRVQADQDVPLTRAEQGQPILRCYGPLDIPDWIWTAGRYQQVKLYDAIVRQSLQDEQDADDYAVMFWDAEGWTRYDSDGAHLDEGQHGMGVCPIEIHRARLVPGMPDLGGSVLGDPALFRDHYNLLSELREMLRGQTFSMLNIQLAPDEDIGQARGLLGEAASVETIVWSKGPAGFIQPDKGPAEVYQAELQNLERKLFRLAGLPWEGDSAAAESADSRRLKAMDLNRMLAMYADEAERVELALVQLWYRATSGVTEAAKVTAACADVTIHYPDEFATIDTTQAAADVRDIVTMQLGQTATAEARKRNVRIVLPDLGDDMLAKVDAEIDAAPATAQQAGSQLLAKVAEAAPVPPKGLQQAGGQDGDTQLQDAGAAA